MVKCSYWIVRKQLFLEKACVFYNGAFSLSQLHRKSEHQFYR